MLVRSYEVRTRLAQESKESALSSIFKAGFMTAKMLSRFLNKSLSATYKLLKRLERDGLIRFENVIELELRVWVLTRDGIFELAAIRRDESILTKEFRVNRISALTISHELMLQEAHVKALDEGGYSRWVYGHSLIGKLLKRPDAIVLDRNGSPLAIELERFSKSKQRVQAILANYLQEISQGKYERVAYIAPNESRAWSLKKLFHSVGEVLIDGSRYNLESRHHAKFSFYSLADWPNKPIED